MNLMSGDTDPKSPDRFVITLHATCASLFFLCLAVVAVLLSKERIKSSRPTP